MHYTTLFELGAKTWTQDTTFHTHSISNGQTKSSKKIYLFIIASKKIIFNSRDK